MQNSGGCFPPPPGYFQRVREICDQYGVLLVSDEVICAFGRLGHWFGSQRYEYQPDIITFAKGMTSGYSPIGGMIVSDALIEPFLRERQRSCTASRSPATRCPAAVALANLDLFEKEDLLGNVRANEAAFRATLEKLYDLPIVGDVRGAGYFYGIELVKDKATRETFNDDECERLLRGFLSQALFDAGLICRADDRGDPVIQLAPPLICGQEHSTTSSRSCAPCSPRPGRASEGTFIGWRNRPALTSTPDVRAPAPRARRPPTTPSSRRSGWCGRARPQWTRWVHHPRDTVGSWTFS